MSNIENIINPEMFPDEIRRILKEDMYVYCSPDKSKKVYKLENGNLYAIRYSGGEGIVQYLIDEKDKNLSFIYNGAKYLDENSKDKLYIVDAKNLEAIVGDSL